MKRGWCPGIYDPMPTGDGLLVRVKPPGSRLSSDAARIIAAAAAAHGNGTIELTSRGNLQIRGLTQSSAPAFAAAMVQAGLASADPAAERRRNVSLSPLASALAADWALAIETMLEQDPAFDALPAKFSIAVQQDGLAGPDPSADITLRLTQAQPCIVISAGLAGGESPGHIWQAAIPPDLTLATIRRLALGTGGQRVRAFIAAHGAQALYAAATLIPSLEPASATGLAPGFDAHGAVTAMLAFGETDCASFAALAELAARGGGRAIWLTAFRAIVLPGASAQDARDLMAAGFVTDARDPRLRLSACIGQAGCASGTVRPRADAARIARAIGGPVHVSGCAKGCAHPGIAPVTLVGNGGLYDIIRQGRAGDCAEVSGLSVDAAARWLERAV
jgi:precorrin-3B synthase